ncbi:MAG: nucleoside kinase [Muribaculaceae bacterium]|nr:nucleoside kinase [Muribaculaceae bacterium]
MKPIKIYCVNTADSFEVGGGSTLQEIASQVLPGDNNYICALVNNKTEALDFILYSPKRVEFLTIASPEGREVYIRSLCMVLYKAVRNLFPHLTLRIELSISRGYYCRLLDANGKATELTAEEVGAILDKMRQYVAQNLPFHKMEEPTEDVIRVFAEEGLTDKTELLGTLNQLYTSYYRLGDTADSYYQPLVPSTGILTVFNIRPYKKGFLLLGPDSTNPTIPAFPIEQEKMHRAFVEHLRFNRIIRVANVGELNKAVEKGNTADLINVAEALHNKLLGRISDEIAERRHRGEAGIVLIAGPSSSGKTTSGKRLAIQLMTNLITPKMISLDDYFVNREMTPRDESGDYDFESLYALDLQRFNSDLQRLLAGEEINLPTYSFELGARVEKPRPLRLDANDVLIIEGIHGLNPELTASIDPKNLYKIYVSALTTLRIDNHNWISTSDTRLLRRIVRDHKYRHISAEETIRRWPSVRRGEEKWIFPFAENADATFNSSLIFEIGVMKEYAEPLLRDVAHDRRQYAVAHRLLRFLQLFKGVPASQVPTTSLLREFLGGSSFHY